MYIPEFWVGFVIGAIFTLICLICYGAYQNKKEKQSEVNDNDKT